MDELDDLEFRIKEVAEAKGFQTAAQLARAARVPQSTMYSLWNREKGDASYKMLLAISTVLGVSVEEIAYPKTAALVGDR